MALRYSQTPKFSRLFKKLHKKYKTLDADFAKLKKFSIDLFHDRHQVFDNKGIVAIKGFKHAHIRIYKVRKFACRSLGGGAMSGLRVTYSHNTASNLIEFIEIYYKGNQANHNSELIKEYLRGKREEIVTKTRSRL